MCAVNHSRRYTATYARVCARLLLQRTVEASLRRDALRLHHLREVDEVHKIRRGVRRSGYMEEILDLRQQLGIAIWVMLSVVHHRGVVAPILR